MVSFLRSKAFSKINQQDIQVTSFFSEILPYLPDRTSQKDELKATIKSYQTQYSDGKQRPLLYLVHGDENEYGYFVRCLLKDDTFSEYFHNGIYEIELLIEKIHTVDKLYQEILKILENKTSATKPEKEAIANRLAKEQQPVIIHVNLLTKDLEGWLDEKTIVDAFIEFWASWPKKIYAKHPLFLVFLSVSYEYEEPVKSYLFWKKSTAQTNSVLLNKLETLHNKYPTMIDFSNEKEVYARVLPKLESVKRISAFNWVKKYKNHIKKFCKDTDGLEEQIKILYKKKNAIPMNELASELKKLLNIPNY